MILRRTQESSLIETSQSTEYLAYSAYQDTSVPVPLMIDINEDQEILGAPFMLMQQLDGVAASPFTPNVYSPHEQKLGEQFWSILGEIAKKDIADDFINQFDNSKIKYDFIFLDPPYKEEKINILFELIIKKKILDKNGILILHRSKKTKDIFPVKFKILSQRVYGLSKIYFGKF